jgi:hypothetical protein
VAGGIAVTDYLVLDPLVAPVWAALVVAGLAAAVLVIARRWRPTALGRGRRAALMTLRLAVVAAVGLMLLRPIVVWQDREEAPGQVAVLIDASRSMAIRDVAFDESRQGGAPASAADGTAAAGPLSRTDAVRVAFLTAGKPYADLGRRCVINPYAFGTHTRPIGEFGPDPADPRTDITETLSHLAEEAEPAARPPDAEALAAPAPPPLAAVILVSDGRANRGRGAPEDLARQLAERGVPVHTVLVGSAEPSDRVRDVAVRDLRAPARIFLGNRPSVRAVVATVGLAGRTVDAVLSVDGKEVERRRVAPASNQTAQELVFSPPVESLRVERRLDKAGLARIAVAVEPVEGELTAANNRAETAVRVEEGDVRVLYLDGRIHPENKYVTRVLGEAKEIELDRRILIGKGAAEAAPGPADLDAYQVVILGDLPASALPAPLISRMAERVQAGSLSVLATGGLSALGAGGWAETPLAAVLPVAIRAGDGQVAGPIRFRPTADGLRHFIFAPETGAAGPAAFDALPPLSGANVVGALDPTARLLAESADGRTLLAVREFGRRSTPRLSTGGRAAVLAVDTTWLWVLAPGEARGAEIHRRLWRQLVLWLAGRDDRPQADLSVATDRPRYRLTDPDNPPEIEVTVHVRESAGAAGPTVTLTRQGDAGRAIELAPKGSTLRGPQGLTAGGGRAWQTILTLREAGIYTLAAEATVGGAAKRAETRFVLEEQDFEWANILADRTTMERIAEAGGGTCRLIGELSNLLADLAAGIQPQFVSVERRLPLASGRVFLAAVLALLAAEWLLRRKWTMV